MMISIILRKCESLLAVILKRVLSYSCSLMIKVSSLALIWMNHLVVMMMTNLFRHLFSLNLSHPSATAHVVWICARNSRALLQETIIDFSSWDWHSEQNSCLIIIVIVVEVLQHEKSPALCFLWWEHIHQSLISQSRESETRLSMNLSCFLLVIEMTRFFTSCHNFSSQLSWQ